MIFRTMNHVKLEYIDDSLRPLFLESIQRTRRKTLHPDGTIILLLVLLGYFHTSRTKNKKNTLSH